MMKVSITLKKSQAFFSILMIALWCAGCRKFVEIQAPTTQLATTSVFSSDAAATSAQLALYVKMGGESYNVAQMGGLSSDELTNYSSTLSISEYYTNSLLASTPATGEWQVGYQYIYACNDIIGQLQNNKNISATVVKQLTGESKFVRAFWYFYLTNLYGDVPLTLTTDYHVNGTISRTPQAQVYDQIIADLKDAESSLNVNYVDLTDSVKTTERVRPNKATASALLARVYLYTKQYNLAETEAGLLIGNSTYGLCSNLAPVTAGTTNYVFQKNSTEAVWQLQPPIPNSTGTDAYSWVLQGAPYSGGYGNVATISPQLVSSFEPGDKRKAQWIGTYTTTGASPVSYFYPFKYQFIPTTTISSTGNLPEYIMMLRLAEQYLIRAEARVQQGNIAGGLQDLNIIRNRANLANYAGATDQASVLTAILHERQVELFTEWGHRWFDLKRTGLVDAVMGGPNGVTHAKGGTWQSSAQLFPIPQNDITADVNLKQNPGY